MSKDNLIRLEDIANRFRDLCTRQIEELEDRLPSVTNLLEKDQILKEIDALHELADNSNREAEVLIKEYGRRRDESKS
tara:strand:- start:179 stop:412 length:234 start_codon:yes stop_codon:yes gene_type:complete